MNIYEIYVLFHIAGAVIWVGSSTYLAITSRRVLARNDDSEVKGFMADASFLGPRLFIPISLITVVFGVLAVIEGDWGFDQPWVSAGLGMFILSFILGAGFVKPRIDKLDAMGSDIAVSDPGYRKVVDQVMLISRIELAFLWAIIAVMVIKPG